MWNFQDTFETRKQSFTSVFSNCMAVPLKDELHVTNNSPISELFKPFNTQI